VLAPIAAATTSAVVGADPHATVTGDESHAALMPLPTPVQGSRMATPTSPGVGSEGGIPSDMCGDSVPHARTPLLTMPCVHKSQPRLTNAGGGQCLRMLARPQP
jgi:hypothetical protein